MISKIYHISDIHVRLYKRHAEYEEVFDRLFRYIIDTKDEDSVIVLAGDIVHSKTDMSPELISVVSTFLKRCADILPTILITGNHDAVRNRSRLDALSPLVDSLNHSNLFYWKRAGVYRFNGVAFSVFSIIDKRENWVYASDISDDYKIALYHGPVMGSINDLGAPVGMYGISVDMFDGFDLGICGDIHRMQYMNRSKTVGYSSSLICQSYSEHPINHGILVWDLKTKISEFVRIRNDYAYATFHIKNGKGNIPNDLPPNLRVRIKHETTTPLQIEQFVERISRKYNITELVKIKVNNNNVSSISDDRIFGNSRDVSYQNQIITDYLKSIDDTLSEADIARVCELNLETNRSLNTKPVIRNIVWKLKRLEFSNMFSYGEDNVVNFEHFDGLYGIFSPNAQGKSSLISCICFALYDKTPTTSKSIHVLNIHKESFNCKLQFEMNGIDYFVERVGYKKPDGNVRVDVNFWYYDECGNEVSLNGEDRDKTNYAIRDFIGQYDDFLMTALSTQYDNQSFVEKSQRERKELLYKFLDISIYDDLWKIAKEQFREYQILIRQYETEDLRQKCDNLSSEIGRIEVDICQLIEEQSKVNKIKKDKTDDLVALNKEYVSIDRELNRDFIDQNIKRFEDQIVSAKEELESIKSQIRNIRESVRLTKKNIVTVDGNVVEMQSEYDGFRTEYNRIDLELKTLESELSHCELKQNRLSTHEYDPNCRFCVNNEFVQDARSAIAMIPELKGRKFRLQIELSHYAGEMSLIELQIAKIKEHQEILQKIASMESSLNLFQEKETNVKYRIKSIGEQLKNQHRRLAEWSKNKLQIERNVDIERSIKKIKDDLEIIDKKEIKVNNQIKQKYIDIERVKKDYEDTSIKLNSYIECLQKYRIHDLYLRSVSKEGVPYKILQLVLPAIEHEVNIILSQIAEFTVRLETLDEKNVHAYIVYGDTKSWPVELTSGMERFVLSLAFRQALSEITSLPRPNFMAIDEGFGVLDSENLQAISRLFNYLKGQYDYLLIISHIDSMRDMVDKQLRIDKINGFSELSVH